MAKQSFVTGQVLTAAQLTSLQQTAMSGGAASAKTANYVLVAADAGTAISMTSTSATTITVNTGLFAAGDTVFIQNLGSATCTITAGTATVDTAGSLILPQYDAGILYFVSSSSAVFYDYIQVGATSPLTTKGDLYTFGTSDTRLPVGTNGHTLVANSATSTGLEWQAPAGGSGFTLIDTISFSGVSSQSVNDVFSATYLNYRIVWSIDSSAASEAFKMRLRVSATDNTSANYNWIRGATGQGGALSASGSGTSVNDTSWEISAVSGTRTSQVAMDVFRPFDSDFTGYTGNWGYFDSITNFYGGFNNGSSSVTTSYTGFTFFPNSGTITGSVRVYGYAN